MYNQWPHLMVWGFAEHKKKKYTVTLQATNTTTVPREKIVDACSNNNSMDECHIVMSEFCTDYSVSQYRFEVHTQTVYLRRAGALLLVA